MSKTYTVVYIANFTTTNWVKPAERIFLTSTLLMRALLARNNTKESLVMRLPVREAHTVYLNNSITLVTTLNLQVICQIG